MKAILVYVTGWIVLITGFTVAAKETALQYKFTNGETNAYAVDISVQSENGTESTTGVVSVVAEKVTGSYTKLLCRMDLRQQMHRQPMWQYGGGGYMWMGNNFFPNGFEMVLDSHGQVLRDGGDRVLSAPLGTLVKSIFEPLPGAAEETTATVAIMDEPQWLGPAENFQNSRMNGMPVYYNGMGPRTGPGLLYLSRLNTTHFNKGRENSGKFVSWHRHSEYKSPLKTGDSPEFTAISESDFTFDRAGGFIVQVNTEGDVNSQTDSTTRKAKVSFKAHRLTGDEMIAALAPPAPVAPKVLAGADLDKVMQDLKSDDLETRRGAVRQLNGTRVDNPPDGMVEAVAAMALDGDTSTQMGAASFLADYATANQVPVLLKLLKGQDWGTRQNVMKALGRLKDPSAIQPLVELVATNPNMGQMDLNNAIIRFGSAAEPAVLTLFTEKNTDTRRQACAILQQIGTTNSLPALQNLAGDPDQMLGQAATEAIRNIKMRQ